MAPPAFFLHFASVVFLLASGLAQAATSAATIRHATENYNPSATPAATLPPGFQPVNAFSTTPIVVEKKSPGCVETACKVGSCTFKSDVGEFTDACKSNDAGVVDGDCVREICARDGCPFRSQILEAIQACRKPATQPQSGASHDCMKTICGKVGCTSHSEVLEVAKGCSRASNSCVTTVCGESGCNYKSEAMDALKSCSTDSLQL